jgi:hypothetical protein
MLHPWGRENLGVRRGQLHAVMIIHMRGAMGALSVKTMGAIRRTSSWRHGWVTLLEVEGHLMLLGDIGVVGGGAALRRHRRHANGLFEHLIVRLIFGTIRDVPSW